MVLISYIFMILMNFLANFIPLGGVTTGEISERYFTLFTPIGLTFSIWGLIYLLLAGYVFYHYKNRKKVFKDLIFMKKIAKGFIISSLANGLWILAWHYDWIGLSVVLMLILLVSLALICKELASKELEAEERWWVKLPFNVYFGWITVATVANITVFLTSIQWNQLGISDEIWTMIILAIAAIIIVLTARALKSRAYLSVGIWAYLGIALQYIPFTRPDFEYKLIAAIILFCLVSFLVNWINIHRKKTVKT